MNEQSLEKWVPELASKEDLYSALDKALDYRGDVTITLKNNTKVTGYIFNCESKAPEPFVQLFPSDKDEKISVFYKDIAALFFSGIDTAAGKSWAAWVAKYKAKEATADAGH